MVIWKITLLIKVKGLTYSNDVTILSLVDENEIDSAVLTQSQEDFHLTSPICAHKT